MISARLLTTTVAGDDQRAVAGTLTGVEAGLVFRSRMISAAGECRCNKQKC
jgi:hypothetical protein